LFVLLVPVLAVPRYPPPAGGFQPGLTGLADRFSSSFVFVVGTHIF
jgi:hypothetical protein